MPDFYQGTELWDLTLVDPDNRRPVDYDAARRGVLAGARRARRRRTLAADLLDARRDGRVKMFVDDRRRSRRAARGATSTSTATTSPLDAVGARRDCLFAFARRHDGRTRDHLRAAAGRVADARRGAPPLGRAVWGDTRDRAAAPIAGAAVSRRRSPARSSSRSSATTAPSLTAAAIFERFPVALLVDRPLPHAAHLPTSTCST